MKMVSAAKYARAERELRQARPYGEGVKVNRNDNNINKNIVFTMYQITGTFRLSRLRQVTISLSRLPPQSHDQHEFVIYVSNIMYIIV